MQINVSKNSAVPVKSESRNKLCIAPTLFEQQPNQELTLDQFELLSMERLQLLRSIEMLKARGFEEKELYDKIREAEGKHLRGKSKNDALYGSLDEVQKDLISHYILRLAYCRTEDLRRWFLTQETLLFKMRLDYCSDVERKEFMEKNDLYFHEVSSAEKNAKETKLKGLAGINENNFYSAVFYKVPFQQALQLIAPRQVYLERGMAYIPVTRLLHIITVRFRQNLSHALTEASTIFDRVVSADTRIAPLLKNMSKQFIGADFASRNSGLNNADKLSSPEQVEEASKLHFPLCMKHLHNGLQREHKLKHWGRLQYTLFLKGCGLDLEGAVALMQSHFTKVMSSDQFVKSYAYSFRHMFGKEGARRNYTPYSCMKIINGSPPETGAYHGCVFKHAPDSVLISLLTQEKLSPDQIREIVSLARSGSSGNSALAGGAPGGAAGMTYQLACQRHFDVTHPDHLTVLAHGGGDARSEAVANHPNQWFQASVQYHRIKNNTGATSATSNSTASAATSTTTATTQPTQDTAMQVDTDDT